MFGVTTLIITCGAIYLRVNVPLAIFTTYAMGPLHLLLFIPFIRIGESVLNAEHTLLTFQSIKDAFRSDYFETIKELTAELVCGITGWTLVAIPIGIVLFFILWKTIAMLEMGRAR